MKYKNYQEIKKFFFLMKKVGLRPEEFIFNSIPYVNGMITIIDKVKLKCLNSQGGDKILDIGCGTGLTSYLLAQNNRVFGIDVFSEINETQQAFLDKGIESQMRL